MKYKILILLIWVFSNINAQTQYEASLNKTIASFNTDTSTLLAKRDTSKFASDIRNSVSSRFQDSCLSGVTVSRLLDASSSESRSVSYGKTITNPQVLLTVKSDITGAQSIILTQVDNTSFTYGMVNSVPFDVNYQVYYRVCPNYGIGF